MDSSQQANNYLTEILTRDQINDGEWDAFVASSPQGAPYAYSWYLDVVWPGWRAVAVVERGQWLAVMPFRVSKKYGVSYIYHPPFCQYLGVFLRQMPHKNNAAEYSLKKRIVKAIVESLPKEVKVLNLKLAPSFDYPLPFHWAGYELRTRYSYWLDNQEDKQILFRNLDERTRTTVNRARREGLSVEVVADISGIIALAKQHGGYHFDEGLLLRLWDAMRKFGNATALEVRDVEQRLHAGLVFQRFGNKLIHLFSGRDPKVGNQGGLALAVWASIEGAGAEVEVIDFEGSMLEPVEHFFRSFGTRPVSYLEIRANRFPKVLRWLFG